MGRGAALPRKGLGGAPCIPSRRKLHPTPRGPLGWQTREHARPELLRPSCPQEERDAGPREAEVTEKVKVRARGWVTRLQAGYSWAFREESPPLSGRDRLLSGPRPGSPGMEEFLPQHCLSASPLPTILPSPGCHGRLLSFPCGSLLTSSSEKPSLTIWLRDNCVCSTASHIAVMWTPRSCPGAALSM